MKLNVVFWLLFAWGAMGYEWSYSYAQTGQVVRTMNVVGQPPQVYRRYTQQPRPLDWESMLAFALLALPTGMVVRMVLLRWRRGYLVGLILAALVVLALSTGVWFRQFERDTAASGFTADFYRLMGIAGCFVLLGSWVVFGIWTGLVRLFLPTRVAKALLEWQQSPSYRASDLSRS